MLSTEGFFTFKKERSLTERSSMKCPHWLSIAGLHVTSRRPCWWSRKNAFLSSGNYSSMLRDDRYLVSTPREVKAVFLVRPCILMQKTFEKLSFEALN